MPSLESVIAVWGFPMKMLADGYVEYDGWAFTAEYLGMKALDQLAWRDITSCAPGSANCTAAVPPPPDAALGRVRYGTNTVRTNASVVGGDILMYIRRL